MVPVHEITSDEQGNRFGTDGKTIVTLLEPDGRMFKRRAIKSAGTPEAREVCWLVTVVGDVRIYQEGNNIVVTRKDLYP